MLKRLTVIAVIFAVMFSALYMRIYVLVTNEKYSQAAAAQSACSLTVGNINANIYDRNFEKLTNTEYKYIAAVNPTVEAAEEILPHVIDKDEYYSQLVCGAPFTCEVDTNEFKSRDITAFAEAAQNLMEGGISAALDWAFLTYAVPMIRKNTDTAGFLRDLAKSLPLTRAALELK